MCLSISFRIAVASALARSPPSPTMSIEFSSAHISQVPRQVLTDLTARPGAKNADDDRETKRPAGSAVLSERHRPSLKTMLAGPPRAPPITARHADSAGLSAAAGRRCRLAVPGVAGGYLLGRHRQPSRRRRQGPVP